MTRIFDDPAEFADDVLTGFVAVHGDSVSRVDGGVVRTPALDDGKVAVVIGGGSGHYPAFAGLVGPGLAAGAACGNVFSSPSAGQVYRVARGAEAGGGVLFCYGNYAGDVMQFGQAQSRLTDEGIETRTVWVTDDIASASARENRRGIAGDFVVFKVAGAAAEAGFSLDEVERVAQEANRRTFTLGVAFDGCTLPGATGPLFTVPEGMMSIGLGIHGEPGIVDHELTSATGLAKILVARLLDERPESAGNGVAVLVNGLGRISPEELFLFFGKAEGLLRESGLEIISVDCANLVTSLDMSGISLTLFWVDDDLEPLWTAECQSPAYRRDVRVASRHRAAPATAVVENLAFEPVPAASSEFGQRAVEALDEILVIAIREEASLGRLDSVAGDGDHGIGMHRGAKAAAEAGHLAARHGAGVRDVLIRAGQEWSERAGGTSGALWGAGLAAIGKSLGDRETYVPEDAVAAASAFREAVSELGQTALGDKTMLDSIAPFTEEFAVAVSESASVSRALLRAAVRARVAAEQTADLLPRKGRARPLAERSIGHPDPGAISFACIVAGLAEKFSAVNPNDHPLRGEHR